MRVDNKYEKRSITFEEIREATIFTKRNSTYIKGNNGAAVNMETGEIIYPANDADGGWDRCYIYPRASLKLS